MAVKLRPLRQTRGGGLYSVTGSIRLMDFAVGQSVVIEIDHRTLRTNEDSSLFARFADSPLVTTLPLPGFRVEPVCDGTNGDQCRILVTYLGIETIMYVYPEADVYIYPEGYEADYFYEESVYAGIATLTWTRIGVLSDDAD